jgi:hypothetical protein
MTDTVASSLGTISGRLTKGMRLAVVAFAVLVLMALSFTLGRATIDRAAHSTPSAPATIAPELGCSHPGFC